MDAAFLMQQLEMRERLEHIKKEDDPLAALDVMAKDLKAATQDMMARFSVSYESEQIDEAP